MPRVENALLMTAPTTPSPAATLVLLRDRAPDLVETLLIQRHAASRFAGGDHVFPGGKVEAHDIPDDVERFCRGLTGAQAAARLGLTPREALGYWVGAIREAFEEVGVLLAYAPDGRFVRFTDENRARFDEHRTACQARDEAFFAMLRAEALTLATDRLAYFAHWITPEESPIRFDTRFFAAVTPDGQAPTADGREIVALSWLTPDEAIAARHRREMSMRFPTLKNLELIANAGPGSAQHVVERLGTLPVPAIRPRILHVEGRAVAVLPDDPRWY